MGEYREDPSSEPDVRRKHRCLVGEFCIGAIAYL